MDETVADVWAEVEAKAESCRKTWGIGFPVISVHLLKPYMRRIIDADRRSRSAPPEKDPSP